MVSLRMAVISAPEHGSIFRIMFKFGVFGGDCNAKFIKVRTLHDVLLPNRQNSLTISVPVGKVAPMNHHGQFRTVLIDVCLATYILLASGRIPGGANCASASVPATFFRGSSDSGLEQIVMCTVDSALPAALASEVDTHSTILTILTITPSPYSP